MNDQSVARDTSEAQPIGTTAGKQASGPRKPGRRWLGVGLRLFVVVLAAAVAIVIAQGWDEWISAAVLQTTDDAYLDADTTPLAAKVPGYVRRMLVKDFQTVKAGDLLVEIVDDDYRAEVAEAEANLAGARATLATIGQQKVLQRALIEQAEATIKATEADVIRYRLEAKRQQTLLATRLAGTEQLTEQAVDNAAHSEATLALNHAQLAQQRQQLNVLVSQQAQAKATLAAQTATRDLAQINLGYTRIVAPVDGMVSQRLVQDGQYLSVGTQVLSLVPLPDVWVVANYKETQMTHVRVGQTATVTVDAFPGVTLHGHVDSWSPASGAVFSLLPPDNATGNFTKIVQRIPVKIVLDRDPSLDDLLRPGMSVVATIDTQSRADGRAVAR
jgi:membrane fusion protein, multidrug efflux system